LFSGARAIDVGLDGAYTGRKVPLREQSLMTRLIYLAGLLILIAAAVACTSSSEGGSAVPSLDVSQALSTQTPVPTATLPVATPTPVVRVTISLTPGPTKVVGQATYIVQPGDTAFGIAAKFGISVSALASANNLEDPRLIRSGQKLIIPGQ